MNRQFEIFIKLVMGPFCGHLINVLYSKRVLNERMYREGCYNVRENALTTRPHDGDIQFDGIICLNQFSDKSGKKNVHYRKTVGIEIKTSVNDILESSIDKYLGATPYFFVASPKELLPTVIFRYRHHPLRQFIGIVDTDNSYVVVMPKQQDYDRHRLNNILAHCYTSVHRYSAYNDTEPFSKAMVTQFPEKSVFVDINGLCVNAQYRDYYI